MRSEIGIHPSVWYLDFQAFTASLALRTTCYSLGIHLLRIIYSLPVLAPSRVSANNGEEARSGTVGRETEGRSITYHCQTFAGERGCLKVGRVEIKGEAVMDVQQFAYKHFYNPTSKPCFSVAIFQREQGRYGLLLFVFCRMTTSIV